MTERGVDKGEGPDHFHLLVGSHTEGPAFKGGVFQWLPIRTTQQEAGECRGREGLDGTQH